MDEKSFWACSRQSHLSKTAFTAGLNQLPQGVAAVVAVKKRPIFRCFGLQLPILAIGLLSVSSAFANFDPTTPNVLQAYEGEATYAKRQAALAGLNYLRNAASLDRYGNEYGSFSMTGGASLLSISYRVDPTIYVNTLLSVSADDDLGLPGVPVSLNNALLRTENNISTSRAFNIGDGGAVIDTNGFSLSISGDLVADGMLLKQGEGVLALTGDNTWNSTPYLHGGTLRGNTSSLQTSINSGSQGAFVWEQPIVCLALGCGVIADPPFIPEHPPAGISPVVEFNQDFEGTYSDVIRGTAQLIKSGAGIVHLTGENKYKGMTTILSGTLALVDAGEIGAGKLQIDSGATFDIAGADSSRTLTGLSGSGQIKLGEQRLNLALSEDAVFGGIISGSGRLAIESASLTLTEVSDFTGRVSIDNGSTLALAGVGTLNSQAHISANGTFDISAADGDRQVGNFGWGSSGRVELGSNYLTIGADNGEGYFSGQIVGAGGLTKVGTGTFYMDGAAEYTGMTRIEQGIYNTHVNGLSDTVINNSTLMIDHTYEYAEEAIVAYSGDISGDGELIKTGNGVVWLRGDNSYEGGTQIESGALIGNTQSLQGDFTNSADLGFYQIEDGEFSGHVQGDGRLFKFGPGKLSLTAENSHTGGTFFTGTLAINHDAALGDVNSALHITNGILEITDNVTSSRSIRLDGGGGGFDTSEFNLELAGYISGYGALNKLGVGALHLTGVSGFAGLTQVQEGRLDVGGLFGDLQVVIAMLDPCCPQPVVPNPRNIIRISQGAELGGDGLIYADVINSGRIARGTEIGDLDVIGNMDFNAGSSFLVKVNAAGEADRIRLSGFHAKATLQGGHVNVEAQSGEYKKRTRYTILTAPGGVEGQFADVSSNFAFLDPQLSYDPQNVFLRLTRNDVEYADVGVNPTQRAAGRAMDSMGQHATADAAFVLDRFDALTAAEASSALQSIAGSDISGTSQTTQLQQRALVQTTSNRLAYLDSQDGMTGHAAFSEAHRWVDQGASNPQAFYAVLNAAKDNAPLQSQLQGVWIRGFGGAGSVDGGAGAGDTSYDVYGFLAGYDRSIRSGVTYGVMGGYSEGDTSQDRPQSDAKTESWQVGGYGRYRRSNVHFDAVLSYSSNQVDNSRRVVVGGMTRQAKADFDGRAFNAYLEAAFVDMGRVNIQPYASLQFIRQYWDGYTETGAGALNLKVEDSSNNSLRSTFGIRSSFSLETESDAPNTLELRAGWSHEFEGEGSRVARLAGDMSNSRFVINSRALPRDSAVLGVSLISTPKDNITLLTEINGEFNSEQYDISAVVGVRYEW